MAISREVAVKFAAQFEVVRPGDTLIIRVAEPVSAEEAAEIRARLAERLPGVEPLIVVADQLLVYRPDGGDDRA